MGDSTVELSKRIALNIGCGHRLMKSDEERQWVNIDLPGNWSGKKPDIESDVRKLPLPDDYADEAYAIHVLEHMYPWDIKSTLEEWKRVLKPGGTIVIEMPCLDKILYWFTREPGKLRFTWWALYGDPRYKDPAMCHKWAFTIQMAKEFVSEAGFVNVGDFEPQTHYKERDMRIQAQKPSLIIKP